jgi:hypothetical protein
LAEADTFGVGRKSRAHIYWSGGRHPAVELHRLAGHFGESTALGSLLLAAQFGNFNPDRSPIGSQQKIGLFVWDKLPSRKYRRGASSLVYILDLYPLLSICRECGSRRFDDRLLISHDAPSTG